MAQSSIHIEPGNLGYCLHNTREKPTANSIFGDEENEVWPPSSSAAFELYRSELSSRTRAYTERTGRKLHKNTKTHLSAIVNLNKSHTLDDVRRVAELLEKKFGTKVFQIAIHRDEGHIDDDGNPVKNYHAHIEMLGLDKDGNSVRRKLTRRALSELQTEVAGTLGMERGVNYARERKPRPKRLDTYEYKAAAKSRAMATRKAREDERPATLKELKTLTNDLREEFKRRKATREEYAMLEELNRRLKARIMQKELTAAQLRSHLYALRAETLEKQIETLEKENEALKKQVTHWMQEAVTTERTAWGDYETVTWREIARRLQKRLETVEKLLKNAMAAIEKLVERLRGTSRKQPKKRRNQKFRM